MRGRSALAMEREQWLQQYGQMQNTYPEQEQLEGEFVEGAVEAVAEVVPQTGEMVQAMPRVTASTANVRPDRCCVYCGNGVYAPRGAGKIRCPKCFNDLPVQDVTLKGDVAEEAIITAGKITVAEDARVAAKLVATTIDIAGRVLGDVLASNLCTIRETGKQAGKILCRRLDLKPGAEIDGAVELIRDEVVR
ncbi:MAG TPA: polymer-forming cytoskeletal protein [Phycisphaerae bacterium]|nr:polymer-forming cytoskeletal protein [Phycisphaerae bacterium]